MTTISANATTFNTLNLYPNIETAGIVVSGVNLPGGAQMSYRCGAEGPWLPGHPLMRINDGRLVGSLFGLSPSTDYEIKVTSGVNEISGATRTQPEELVFAPLATLHVNSNAPVGGNGSESAPFRTIQEGINKAQPGTQVLVADGIYQEALTFPISGSPGKWIQVKAAGNVAVLDGSEWLNPKSWKADGNKTWFIKLGRQITYLARNRIRFYNYENLTGLKQNRGYGKVTVKEGWYYDSKTTKLYIRSLSDPSKLSWQAPRLNYAFSVTGRDWIWIEGFEIRNYGATTSGFGVAATNASHVVIRRNKIHNLQLGIFINWNGSEFQGNDTRIEENEIFDPPVNEWAWSAVKGSTMEGTGIVLRGHIGAIVRKNEIHHYFNGIYTGSSAALENPEIAFDADIYNNRIHHISDDGLEPEGACINHRFRNNRIDTMLVGISIAPVTKGPTWVMHSILSNFNGTSIKWARDTAGVVLLYHNTSWTNGSNVNAMSLITPIRNTMMRNNIFQGNGYAFEAVQKGSSNNSWNYNNWYTTRPANSFVFKWENLNYRSIALLCAAIGMECNGHGNPPGFVNPAGGDFRLQPASPNIDRGVHIPGINDNYNGQAPDIGAIEFSSPPSPVKPM
ncbi:MAG: right-handed parallel beta-helix repeat-containing protein [Anaerolineae bacterium]|nr:right-handed parallel beta-helix repeat-containing protein [Anaerolineae bacterium]